MLPSASPDLRVRRAWIGLGGNLGDVRANLVAALQQLDAREDVSVAAVSDLYRTPPWGRTDQPDYFNACAELKTRLLPQALLEICLATERGFGRVRSERWGPRTLDIDILAVAGIAEARPGLSLPHPRLTERAFVLVPLNDIAAGLKIGAKTVSAWLSEVETDGIERVAAAADWWPKRTRS